MFKDKKNIAIIILSIVLLIMTYIAIPKKQIDYNKEFIDNRIKELDSANVHLTQDIAIQQKKSIEFSNKIDSLQKVKQKIIIKYVKQSQKVDSASVSVLVNQFSDIFTNNNLK